ncbi:unnamed protein product [Polarella glacialis]|uniref:Uncharacterized protein n=1 Tax=Polarella glacialis TaxID=89957 RepID=A0A813L2V5_POLGL|nr:unnamed protein product [Polarella glacialis]
MSCSPAADLKQGGHCVRLHMNLLSPKSARSDAGASKNDRHQTSIAAVKIFFWLLLPSVSRSYRTAFTIAGIVTLIATYHCVRIFNSWVDSFEVVSKDGGDFAVQLTGAPFNDAYCYVDWLLTVPVLLIELVLVMNLPQQETVSLGCKLGIASALMVAPGYPGEIQEDLAVRWFWWKLAMISCGYVVFTLVACLAESISK